MCIGQVEGIAKILFKLVQVTIGVRVKPVKLLLALLTSECLIESHLSDVCSFVISRY